MSQNQKAILEKMQETLKSDSESLMLKAAEVFRRAHAYAIETKSIMDEYKQKVVVIYVSVFLVYLLSLFMYVYLLLCDVCNP